MLWRIWNVDQTNIWIYLYQKLVRNGFLNVWLHQIQTNVQIYWDHIFYTNKYPNWFKLITILSEFVYIFTSDVWWLKKIFLQCLRNMKKKDFEVLAPTPPSNSGNSEQATWIYTHNTMLTEYKKWKNIKMYR